MLPANSADGTGNAGVANEQIDDVFKTNLPMAGLPKADSDAARASSLQGGNSIDPATPGSTIASPGTDSAATSNDKANRFVELNIDSGGYRTVIEDCPPNASINLIGIEDADKNGIDVLDRIPSDGGFDDGPVHLLLHQPSSFTLKIQLDGHQDGGQAIRVYWLWRFNSRRPETFSPSRFDKLYGEGVQQIRTLTATIDNQNQQIKLLDEQVDRARLRSRLITATRLDDQISMMKRSVASTQSQLDSLQTQRQQWDELKTMIQTIRGGGQLKFRIVASPEK